MERIYKAPVYSKKYNGRSTIFTCERVDGERASFFSAIDDDFNKFCVQKRMRYKNKRQNCVEEKPS